MARSSRGPGEAKGRGAQTSHEQEDPVEIQQEAKRAERNGGSSCVHSEEAGAIPFAQASWSV